MQFILLSFIFSFLSLSNPDIDPWIQTSSESSEISFKMPVKHQLLQKELNGIESEVFQTKDLTCVYGIVASKLKNTDFSKQPVDEIYKAMKEGSLIDKSVILLSEISLPYKKMLIKEIKYSIMRKNKEYIYYKRFIFRKSFAYQITIGAYKRHINELEANKKIFFNSIDFSE